MAVFDTSIPIGYGTDFTPDAGKQVVTAEDGTIIVMNMYGASVYTGTIEVPFATAAEKTTILDFYATNRNLPFTFQHPGDGFTYTLFFTNEPKITRVETHGDVRFAMTIQVLGYRA